MISSAAQRCLGNEPRLVILSRLVGELVVDVEQIGFGGVVVGVLRGDMFERCLYNVGTVRG